MTAVVAQIIAPQALGNANATLYTSTGVTTRVDRLSVTNPTGSSATVTLYLVPSGSSASNANTITSAKTVLPGQTWNCPDFVGQVLKPGDTIQGLASAAAILTISASGTQFS